MYKTMKKQFFIFTELSTAVSSRFNYFFLKDFENKRKSFGYYQRKN